MFALLSCFHCSVHLNSISTVKTESLQDKWYMYIFGRRGERYLMFYEHVATNKFSIYPIFDFSSKVNWNLEQFRAVSSYVSAVVFHNPNTKRSGLRKLPLRVMRRDVPGMIIIIHYSYLWKLHSFIALLKIL